MNNHPGWSRARQDEDAGMPRGLSGGSAGLSYAHVRPHAGVWEAYARHPFRILLCALLFGGIGLVLAASLGNRYTATALLLVETRSESSGGSTPLGLYTADGEVEILKSDSFAAKVAAMLNLDKDPAFAAPEGKVARAWRSLHDVIAKWSGEAASTPDPPLAEGSSAPARMTPAARALQRAVAVHRRGLTDVIAIDATSVNAVRAAEIANTYAQVYLRDQVEAKMDRLEQAQVAMTARLKEYSQQLAGSEAQVGVRDLYRSTLAKLTELSEKRATVGSDARVVSPALAPAVAGFPPRGTIVVLAAGLGFALAWGLAYLRS